MSDGATDIDPSPESTLRDGAEGVPCVLGDGRTWLLGEGGLHPALDEFRDRMFDADAINGSYDAEDQSWVRAAALRLLALCHDLPDDAAWGLVVDAPIHGLARAVEACVFGDMTGRTYSVWARASLRANGCDPHAIPPREIGPTLDALEFLNRALPREWIASVAAARRRAARPRPTPRPAPPAQPE